MHWLSVNQINLNYRHRIMNFCFRSSTTEAFDNHLKIFDPDVGMKTNKLNEIEVDEHELTV